MFSKKKETKTKQEAQEQYAPQLRDESISFENGKEGKDEKDGKGEDSENADETDANKTNESAESTEETDASDETGATVAEEAIEASDETAAVEETEKTAASDEKDESTSPEPSINDKIEEAYCLGAGIDKQTLGEAKAIIGKMAESVNSGVFDPEILTMALKLFNYDSTVKSAYEEGLEAGRNEQITEVFRRRKDAARQAAEIPHFRGAKGIGSIRKTDSIFDVARDAK